MFAAFQKGKAIIHGDYQYILFDKVYRRQAGKNKPYKEVDHLSVMDLINSIPPDSNNAPELTNVLPVKDRLNSLIEFHNQYKQADIIPHEFMRPDGTQIEHEGTLDASGMYIGHATYASYDLEDGKDSVGTIISIWHIMKNEELIGTVFGPAIAEDGRTFKPCFNINAPKYGLLMNDPLPANEPQTPVKTHNSRAHEADSLDF
ncbi:hypothetical protein [Neptuniibacter sp. QD37_11]|uniref:hypothetical protein n=1 Tax=Neptuniibacter sp. QD37_11 TaxID=3398209 RepID=UPI0039F4712C